MAYKRWTREEIERIMPIELILSDCGARDIVSKGDHWLMRSPFHEDRHASMFMYKDTLHWEDPPMGSDYKGGISKLIYLAKGVDMFTYLGTSKEDWLQEQFFSSSRKKEQEFRGYVKTSEYRPEDFDLVIEGTGIDWNLNRNQEALSYARSRFMTDEFLDFFKIGYTEDSSIFYKSRKDPNKKTVRTRFQKRLCIPIFENGRLVSYEGRDYTRKQERKCLYPASAGGGSNNYRSLFNIDNLDRNKPLIICEGIMDIVRIWEHITRNVTSTYGSSIKERQKKVIKEFTSDIIVFSDSDAGGITAIKDMDDLFPEKEFYVAQLEREDPGDPCNSVEDIKRAIDTAVTSTEFLLRVNGLLNRT